MECELSHVQSAGKKSGGPEDLTSDFHKEHSHEQTLQHKLDTLKDRLKFWERRLEEWVCIFIYVNLCARLLSGLAYVCFFCLRVEACHQHNVALASDRRDMMVHFLLLELETVGNIRFEEGNTGEPWYHMYACKIFCTNSQHAGLLIYTVLCFLSQVHIMLRSLAVPFLCVGL